MSGQDRIRLQMRTRGTGEAFEPSMVVCCGHDLDAHDDDGCIVGWRHPEGQACDGCPCRVKGWAR